MNKYLIAGLGNIGTEYDETRHNIGFKILDAYAKKHELTFESAKLGSICTHKIKGRTVFLLKPSTYMNLSGKAIRYWMEKEKIDIENILVITDDLNLPFGTIRLKGKGTDGGHNGLKDIQSQLQDINYPRLRFGISSEFKKGQQVDYVLGTWAAEEETQLKERVEKCVEAIPNFVLQGLNTTMNMFNGK